ncbi:WD repeat-containing protein 55-like isoform X2 [Rosa rugosa]|uniref:WD repeat-containing protein 55-like isoform X2 n=1 Tax=Rosa rugosa TaxID=74645 RepID=UPI002B40178C|nr:WD repeat-containing protein 55-like isoform X2 [Rosa rugosa]
MKNGQKVICSSQSGNILLYSWGCFKDCSDRFIDLSPNSVDALLKLDEDRLIAGSETRLIRHMAKQSHPTNCRALRISGRASCCGIWMIYCKALEILQGTQATVEDKDSDEMDTDINTPKSRKGTKRKNASKDHVMGSHNLFADL